MIALRCVGDNIADQCDEARQLPAVERATRREPQDIANVGYLLDINAADAGEIALGRCFIDRPCISPDAGRPAEGRRCGRMAFLSLEDL
jgi:hypothetical protein